MTLSRWLPPVLWAGLIEVLTSWPGISEVPSPAWADKGVHAMLFGVLAFLSMRAAWPSRNVRLFGGVAFAVLLGVVAFGAVDEWHQQFIPTRAMELADWLADSTGALAGIAGYAAFAGVTKSRRERAQ